MNYDKKLLAEQIVVNKKHELACGMKRCPFHRWTVVSNSTGMPIDSICTLPGDGGNVLSCAPFNEGKDLERRLKINGQRCGSPIKRLPKCLKVKPLSKENA